jgi:hypothetical protein
MDGICTRLYGETLRNVVVFTIQAARELFQAERKICSDLQGQYTAIKNLGIVSKPGPENG